MSRPNDGYKLRRGAITDTQPGIEDSHLQRADDRERKAYKELRGILATVGVDLPKERPPTTPAPEREWKNPGRRPRLDPAEAAYRERRRQAKKKGGPRVNRAEIIERDKGRCWICKKYVAKSLIHLDHVIPLSKGGAHHPSNVKVACKSCNEWKGDRIITVP